MGIRVRFLRSRVGLVATVALLGLWPLFSSEALADTRKFSVGLRLGMFDMVNSPDTYDTIYGDPMVQVGVQFEYYPKPWWFLGVSLDHGSVDGEQVALIPEPFPTGVETELTLTPLQLRIGRVVRSSHSWRFPFARVA